ncbi:MAG: diaminopimelate decarboxylase [Pseudobutyrivibrio ruminis]|uniref:Diaminopimelate decarboxylase n=1 Tax=Pseudobutyrivibrio ruminis TaxID=46206 RepID=A0A927U7K1_9FIRM|nr:diaminopimelate decarboxylase [Pseudobutyrivibrio ruminis]
MINTPAYIFNLDILQERVDRIKSLVPDIELTFSIKANPFLVPYIIDMVRHVEVCSPGELAICKADNIPAAKIIYSGLLKEEWDITEAIGYGVDIITAESPRQLKLIEKVCAAADKKAKVLLRLTSGNQFGMDEETLMDLVNNIADYPHVDLAGIHYFSGTQKVREAKFAADRNNLYSLFDAHKNATGNMPAFLEFGPGAGVEYFDGPSDDKDFANFETALPLINDLKKDIHLGIEMGRFIASTCGRFETTVKEIKPSKGINYVLVDGGIHHLNYYGQIQGMKIPELSVSETHTNKAKYCIVGSLCTTADVLVREVELTELAEGDVLTFNRCGAYSVTEAPNLFLSRRMPCIYVESKDLGLKQLRDGLESYRFNDGQN